MEILNFITGLLGRIWTILDSYQSPFGVSYLAIFLGFVVAAILVAFILKLFGGGVRA